jgi:hypothetical protein
MAEPHWTKALKLGAAWEHVQDDARRDWYLDPWQWRECQWIVDSRPELIVARLNAKGVCRTLLLDVPKENFVTRPAIVFDPLDRLCYQALVDYYSAELIGGLKDWVYGWRLLPANVAGGYAGNKVQWQNYLTTLSQHGSGEWKGLATDVVSFFASIRTTDLVTELEHKLNGSLMVARLTDLLAGWSAVKGRSGLPQRSLASCVLAHFFLRPIDELLERLAKRSGASSSDARGAVCRWMDDIWLFGRSRSLLREAQLELQDALRAQGLEINSGKTNLWEGPELVEKIAEIEHNHVASALAGRNDPLPLQELLERLLRSPEDAPRTSVKFSVSKMQEHQVFDMLGELVACAERMPHVADSLARLFKDTGRWRDLQSWFLDLWKGPFKRIPWTLGKYAEMFPRSPVPDRSVRDFLAETLAEGQLPDVVVPTVAARLVEWDPSTIGAIQAAGARYENPFCRRALALAGLQAGAPRREATQLLREHAENRPLLLFLEDTGFRALPVIATS